MKSLLAALVLLPSLALANPRALPMTYTTDTLPEGAVEIEQYVDLVPLRAQDAVSGERVSYLGTAFQTEIEIGLLPRLELGLYVTYAPDAGPELVNQAEVPGLHTGAKQRLRYIFADLGEWPVDVGVYGEMTETATEIELEGKLLLMRRFDRLRVAANLSVEYELYLDKRRDLVLNPSLGATYEISPKLSLGLDSFLRGEYPQNPKPASRSFGLGPAYYVGPAVMTNFGKLWWSVGAYVRATDFGHDLQPGEPFGKVYFRSMIGYNL